MPRHLLAVLSGVALLLAACGPGAANPIQRVVAATHAAPLAPASLHVTTPGGQAVAPNGWTNQKSIKLAATLASPESGAQLTPEVEFLPVGEPFTGVPNVTGTSGEAAVNAPDMAPGQQYHWQLRAREAGGQAGPWVPFDGTIGFDPTPPPSPSIISLPNGGNVATRQVKVSWDAVAGKSGIAGFAYAADQSPQGLPPQQASTKAPSATIDLGQDGDWFFHVRTLDNAGNWSPVATAPLHLDTVPLKIADPFYRSFVYNPGYDTLHIAFSVSKPAKVMVTILPDKADTPLKTFDLGQQPAGKVTVEWDGKTDTGATAAVGAYRFRVLAKDKSGNSADAIYNDLHITNKRIVISLGQQKLWAYTGDKADVESLITSGNRELPTPEGTFQVLTKQKDFVFHSPWPKGDKFWYPDSPTKFAMMFDDGGYFIHDAPWRHKFGPGSNLVPGQPGEDVTGTHGCINVPADVQVKLFSWTDLGTPVVIQK